MVYFDYRVMVIEDDEAIANGVASKLRSFDIEVKVLPSGEGAIEQMKEWMPHLVVLDLHLPGKTGVQIAKEMRSDPKLREILRVTNSSHMGNQGNSLGDKYFYQERYSPGGYVREEPWMVDKLKPSHGLRNDLIAYVIHLLGTKYGVASKKMNEYIDSKGKSMEGKDEGEDWDAPM